MTDLNHSPLFPVFAAIALASSPAFAQLQTADRYMVPGTDQQAYRYNINIPSLDGYQVLKCDFHIHTVFSDGQVWPSMRVTEAWNQGLDAIAITDHIEYRPNKDALAGDLNKSNEIARQQGERIGMLVVPGTEITRSKPLGHINALFVKDVNKIDVKDELAAVEEANSQGAFVFWNHPGWPDGASTLYPVHEKLIAAKKIRGAEVYNGSEMYPKAVNYCKDNSLAFMANSDIHVTTTTVYREKLQRPMTLVFAKERTLDGIKEALFAGRTLACFDNHLAGKEEYIKEIIKKSLAVKVIDSKKGVIEISNNSDLQYSIKFGNYMYSLPLYANQTLRVNIASGTDVSFTNCLIGQDKYAVMKLW